jgi:hypothetical protein
MATYFCRYSYNRLVSVNYQSPFFTKHFKTPFPVSLVCLQNYETLELLMMGIMVPETCWANNKICNKNHLLHLVGIFFPHINDDARSKSLQIFMNPTLRKYPTNALTYINNTLLTLKHSYMFQPSRGCHQGVLIYRGADKSLARPGRKQATATEDFEFHISYL